MNKKSALIPVLLLFPFYLIRESFEEDVRCPPPRCINCSEHTVAQPCTTNDNCTSYGRICCQGRCGKACMDPYNVTNTGNCPSSVPLLENILNILPCIDLPLGTPCNNDYVCCKANFQNLPIVNACVCPAYTITFGSESCTSSMCWHGTDPSNNCKIRPDCPSGESCYKSNGCSTSCKVCEFD